MARLHLAGTEKTPEVLFDTQVGTFQLEGCSIHENAERFFRPLIDQVELYIRQPAPQTIVKLSLTYFNSSSSKYILDLLKLMDEIHLSGKGTVLMEWHYEQQDLDMEEAGQDYMSLLEMPVKPVCNPTR